jgi:DNA-directed RNA polymerase subunit D
MAMETITNNKEKLVIKTTINTSLANAIRRSINEIPILAIHEADIYANDSALYDEIIAHRLGLIPLKNQNIKGELELEYKLKVKGKQDKGTTEVLAKELGEDVVHENIPITLLEKDQKIELVAKANIGTGKEHARYSPGIMYYKHYPHIKITGEGQQQTQLAQLYPQVFTEEQGKLTIKDETQCELDEEDLENIPGINITFNDELLLQVESWGQLTTQKMLQEASTVLKKNLSELQKKIKL